MSEHRFVAVLAGWTFLTAVAISLVAGLAKVGPVGLFGFRSARLSVSGPAVAVADLLTITFILFSVVTILLLPVAVSAYRYRTGTYDAVTAITWAVAGLVVFPGAVFGWAYLEGVGTVASMLAIATALWVTADRGGQLPRTALQSTAPAQFVHIGLFVLLLAGIVAGIAVGVRFDSLIEYRGVPYRLANHALVGVVS